MFDRFYLSNHRNYDIVYNYLFILKFLYKSEDFLWKASQNNRYKTI